MFGRAKISFHWLTPGRRAACCAPGLRLSPRMKNARIRFSRQIPAAIQPGPALPKVSRPMMAMIGPQMNPRPKAMPIRPIFFERSSGGVMSAM